MKRFLTRLSVAFPASLMAVVLLFSHTASAYTFNRNNIIDDSVFDNYNTMTASEIDSFLNGFANSCISPNSGFAAKKPIGYNPSQGYLFGDYVSAGEVIYASAQAYGINPQVLLTTLQKEQSLVAGGSGYCNNGDDHKYAAAAGYGCPDGGTRYSYTGLSLYSRNGTVHTSVDPTCVNTAIKAGFSQQVIRAAWLLKFGEQRSKGNVTWAVIRGAWDNSDDPPTCYAGPMTEGTWKTCQNGSATFFDGYKTIDGQAVHVESGATAALYWYTPHFNGNQNFFNIFTSWFGSTVGAAYAWSIESFSYSGGDNTVAVGETETLTLRARNNGRNPWYRGGEQSVRLGTWNSNSAFANGSWFSGNRPAALSEAVVMPNEVGTFTFQITPSVPGTYVESYNLVAENAMWMAWPGFSPTIQVVNGYQWSIDSVSYSSGGGIMEPGDSQTITVKARNTGVNTWNKTTGPPIRMARWGSGGSPVATGTWVSPTQAVGQTESSVAPGQLGTFTFDVRVPAVGNYYERMNLVADGVVWFNDPGLTLFLRGGSYAWQPLWVSHSTGTANIARGQPVTLTIKAKNTGEVAWHRTGIPIRIGTPGNSPFYTTDWFSGDRAATLQEDTVPVGSTGTFIVSAKSPVTPGPFTQRFNLVAEGYMWMPDPGYGIYINSQ